MKIMQNNFSNLENAKNENISHSQDHSINRSKDYVNPNFHEIDFKYDENSLSKDIERHIESYFASHCKNHAPEKGLYDTILKEIEKILICSTMKYADGKKMKAAEILGINRNTLSKKIKELCK